MDLTASFTRVAMPHDEDCPYEDCNKRVKDWFIEWYPPPIQGQIGRKDKVAMDCPWCRRPVSPQGLRVILPPKPLTPMIRDYDEATAYAKTQYPKTGSTPYQSLEEFLTDPINAEKAAPFKRGYWKNVNIP